MRKKVNHFVLLFLIIAAVSCQKNSSGSLTGKYVGTFTVTYLNNITASGSTTLNLYKNGKYNCSRNPNRIPAGGAGTFTKTSNKITFRDAGAWTADFDWNLILNDEYDLIFDGKNLKITAFKNKAGQYEYNLIKQ